MFLEQVPIFNETSIAKRTRTSHITIPAAYEGGVILSVLKSSPYYQLLLDLPEEIPPSQSAWPTAAYTAESSTCTEPSLGSDPEPEPGSSVS